MIITGIYYKDSDVYRVIGRVVSDDYIIQKKENS